MNSASTILIVSGDPRFHQYVDAILRSDGNITIGASKGQESLHLVNLRMPDLIVLSNELDDMRGLEFAKIIKFNHDTALIPILLITDGSNEAARIAGLVAGLEDVLVMPVDAQEFLLRARNLLLVKARSDQVRLRNLQLEKELEERTESLEQIHAAIDTSGDAIIWVSRQSMRVVAANSIACSMLGYTREGLLGLCPTALFGSNLKKITREFDQAIAGNERREIRETEFIRKDGSRVAVEVHRYVQKSHGSWSIATVARDISKRREIEERLYQLAYYDTVTGLPNRTLFYNTLERTLIRAEGTGLPVALLFVDIDYFKAVNDKLGHSVGDQLLGEVGARLKASASQRDGVGRLGGDEFAMVLLSTDSERAMIAAIELQGVLAAPFSIEGNEICITVSIGVTFHREGRYGADTLIKYADAAMYRAKQAGRNRVRLFTSQMNDEIQAEQDLEEALQLALDGQQFVIHYQPQFDSTSKRLAGFEALLRWNRPGYGMLAPESFIGILESSGLILQVGQWVIETVCGHIRSWIDADVTPVRVAVNVSGRQWNETNFEECVVKALESSGIPAELLELEMTESSFMANTEHTTSSVKNLRRLGIRMSIDDFGTGYSSLSYLRTFSVDRLKIDISFIRRIGIHRDDDALVQAIIKIAHSLNLEVVAEGVETEEQHAFLVRNNCDFLQGYLFSIPLNLHTAQALLVLSQAAGTASGDALDRSRTASATEHMSERASMQTGQIGRDPRAEVLYLVQTK